MAVLSLYGHTGMENRQTDEAKKLNIFRHNQTEQSNYKMCISKTSGLAERQLYAENEIKWLVVKQVMQSANCALARQLNMYSWIVLLSLL